MALFKISKGIAANLPQTLHEGYCYFTTDDGKFYIDADNSHRVALNADQAERFHYGEVTNASTSLIKAVAISGIGTNFQQGLTILVKNNSFANGSGVTLNVNNTSAKPIYLNSSPIAHDVWKANSLVLFAYNTTLDANGCWVVLGASGGADSLIGTTSTVTPAQVQDALEDGSTISLGYSSTNYGTITFSDFSYIDGDVISETVAYVSDDGGDPRWQGFSLKGDASAQNGTWTFSHTLLATPSDISTALTDYYDSDTIDTLLTNISSTGGTADVARCYLTAQADTPGRWNVTIPNVEALTNGLTIHVKLQTGCVSDTFPNGFNTLNVNGLGEKVVWFKQNELLVDQLEAGAVITLSYFIQGNGSFEFPINYYDITDEVFTDRGAWRANTSYNINDVVTYNGNTYRKDTEDPDGATFNSSSWLQVYFPTTTLGYYLEDDPILEGWILQTGSGSDGGSGNDYNQRTLGSQYAASSSPISSYKLCGIDANGKVQPLTITTGLSTQKTVNTTPIKPDQIFYFNSDTTCTALSTLADGTLYEAAFIEEVRYSFNSTINAAQDIYLKGILDSSTGLFTLYTANNTSVTDWYMMLPLETSKLESGFHYIKIGRSGITNAMHLDTIKPLYYYDGTNLIESSFSVQKLSHYFEVKDKDNQNIAFNIVGGGANATTNTFDGSQNLTLNLSPAKLGAAALESGVYYVAPGSSSSNQANPVPGDWEGECDDFGSDIPDGLTIIYTIPWAGSDSGTLRSDAKGERTYSALNVNDSGYKPIYFTNLNENTVKRLKTEYGPGDTILLVYHRDIVEDASLGLYEDLSWWQCLADLDTNDPNYRTSDKNFMPYAGSTGVLPYTICMLDKDNRLHSIVKDLQVGNTIVNKTATTDVAFKPEQLYFYNHNLPTAAGNAIPEGTLYSQYGDFDKGIYSFNSNLAPYRNIYLKGSYDSNTGLFAISVGATTGYTRWYVQAPTDTADLDLTDYFEAGYYYLLVCGTGNENNKANFYSTHPIYYAKSVFNETLDDYEINLIPITVAANKLNVNNVGGSTVVNGSTHEYGTYFQNGIPVATSHYIDADVPSDAIFTDTKNTAGVSGNVSNVLYLTGSISQGGSSSAYAQTYTSPNISIQKGDLHADSLSLHKRNVDNSIAGTVKLQYDATNQSLEFIFS